MSDSWAIHEVHMSYAWATHGITRGYHNGYPWAICGLPMGLWATRVLSVGCAWVTHGQPIDALLDITTAISPERNKLGSRVTSKLRWDGQRPPRVHQQHTPSALGNSIICWPYEMIARPLFPCLETSY